MAELLLSCILVFIFATGTYCNIEEIPFFGIASHPNFHNLIAYSPCRQHIITQQLKLGSSNLPTTKDIPVTITTEMNKSDDSLIWEDIFRSRYMLCSTIWLHLDFSVMDGQQFVQVYGNIDITSWIIASTVNHFVDGTGNELKNSLDLVNLIVIPNSNLVNTRFPFFRQQSLIRNFYVLVLGTEVEQFYFHSRPDTVPRLANMEKIKSLDISTSNLKLDMEWHISSTDMSTLHAKTTRPQLQFGNVEIYMINVISEKLNFTVTPDYTCFLVNSYQCIITRSMLFEYYGASPVAILTDFESFSFVSCYKVNNLDFSIYTQPFQLSVWVGIAICLLTITITTDILIKLKGLKISTSLLFVVGSLIDEGGLITRKLLDIPVVRRYIGAWLLLSTVITNAYIGIFINHLISPLPARKFEQFADTFCEESSEITEAQYLERLHLWANFELRINADFSMSNWTNLVESANCESAFRYCKPTK